MFDWFHNRVPYTDYQQKNLDWLTETVREGEAAVEAKIEEADTAIENAEAATEAANTAKTGADDAATAANNAATAANNAKDAANTAAANAQAAADKWATPYASTTVAGMTDHAKIYVYTGSEVGYTAGNWYYWNGSAWTSGGVYVGDITDAVLFNTAQSKTDAEKAQARENCGAASDEELFTTYTEYSHNYLNIENINEGKYLSSIGQLNTNPSYNTSDYISVTPGNTYTFQTGSLVASGRTVRAMRFICGYDAEQTFVSGSYQESQMSYTVPSGVSYIRFSVEYYLQASQNPAFVKGTTVIDYYDYSEDIVNHVLNQDLIKPSLKKGYTYRFSINSNNVESVDDFQDMCAYEISFNGQISTFNGIKIGKGYHAFQGGTVEIDNTNVYVYEGANDTPTITHAHGLTITDYISVVISCKYNNTAMLTINTNGGTYTENSFFWDARAGKLFVRSVNTNVINNCTLGYYCYALEKPTYIYGDSYLTNTQGDTTRWPSYLIAKDRTNYLLNGYSGRGSVTALKALKLDLRYGLPKRIIWCLGMNDADSGSINTNWKACVDELMSICDLYDIELILATIPNVPTIDNSYKNAYVKASGYRYIDFAEAVGATSDTTWYTGMLHTDGVHPTSAGAMALYSQAVADCPELISY